MANTDDVTPAAADTEYEFIGYLSTYPAGGFAQVSAVADAAGLVDTEIYTALGGTSPAVAQSGTTGSSFITDIDGSDTDETYTGNIATASATVAAANFNFTPTVAGTYVLTVFNDALSLNGAVSIGEAVQTISIVVAEASAFSAGLSTSITDYADGSFDATTDEAVYVAKAAGTDGASIMLTLKNTSNAAKGGMRVSAEVSGSGLVDVVTGNHTNYVDATSRADALTLGSGVNQATVHVTADGTAGKGTITIKIQDATTLATLGTYIETVYFYGTVVTLTATQYLKVARASVAGAALGCSLVNCTWATTVQTPAVYIEALDSTGVVVPLLTITALSSDSAVIITGTINEDDATAGDGPGYYNASVTSAINGVSGASATVTFRTQLSSGAYVSTAAIPFTLGGSLATMTLTLDKSSYAPGEAMVVTRTAKDSAGNPVYNGVASPAVIFSKAIGGTAPGAGEFASGVSSSSTSRPTVFAPSTGGAFEARASYTSAVTGATSQITATATVADAAASAAASAAEVLAQAAVDAAAEATDAANAATDAANAAAEAADAATAAAQDAADAVAALSAQVATLIAGLKAQLTALTNLMIKIQKKVKA
jgi:hypothetical protein